MNDAYPENAGYRRRFGCKFLEEDVGMSTHGIHHITAIAGNPQRNIDFYVGILGLRLVKKTVNFDDPHRYHFYYGDGLGHPGTILTFFAWDSSTHKGRRGTGQVTTISLRSTSTNRAACSLRLPQIHLASTWTKTPQHLGSSLKLPPWMEPRRDEIDKVLPPVVVPARAV